MKVFMEDKLKFDYDIIEQGLDKEKNVYRSSHKRPVYESQTPPKEVPQRKYDQDKLQKG